MAESYTDLVRRKIERPEKCKDELFALCLCTLQGWEGKEIGERHRGRQKQRWNLLVVKYKS